MKKLSKVFASLVATVAIMINILPVSTLLTTIANATSTELYFDKNNGDFNYTAGDVKSDFGSSYPSNFDKNSTATSKSNVSFTSGTTYTLTLKAVVQCDENRTYGMPSITIGGDSVGTFAGCNITNKDHPTQDPIWGAYYGADVSGKFTCVQSLTYTPSSSGNKSVVLTFQDDKKDKIGYYSLTIDDGGSGGQTTTYTAAANVATACASMGSATVATTSGGAGAASQTIDENGSAYYVATANSGYQFVKWVATNNASAAAVSTSASYTATITAETTLYAVFEATSAPSATNTKTIEVEDYITNYNTGTQPTVGTALAGYSGTGYAALNNNGSKQYVYVPFTAPANATYSFAITYATSSSSDIYIDRFDSTSGANYGQQSYDGNTYYHNAYAGIGGGNSSSWSTNTNAGSVTNIQLSAGQTILVGLTDNNGRAYFDKIVVTANSAVFPVQATTYEVTTSVNNASYGTITATASYNENSNVTITAAPADGYRVQKWVVDSVDVASTATTYTIDSIAAAHTVQVVFEAIPVTTYQVTTSVNNAGYGSITATASYNEGSNVTITATPADGYRVQKWVVDSSDVASTSTTYTINSIAATHTIQAVFEAIPQYTVSTAVNNVGYGSVTGGATVTEGNSTTLTATPASGYEFTGWSTDGGVNIISTTNPLIVTPTVDVTYTAIFAAQTNTNSLTIEVEDYITNYNTGTQPTVGTALAGYSGTGYAALNNNGSKQYVYVPFTAPANATYSFAITYATSSSSDIYIDRFDSTSGANYGQQSYDGNTYYHNAYAGIGGGNSSSWSTNTNAGSVTNIQLSAGQTILVGLTDNNGRAYFDKIVVTADSAVFPVQATTYEVTTSVNNASYGTITATASYNENSNVTITATPADGYRVQKWVVDSVDVASTATTYTIDSIAAAHTVQVVFEAIPVVPYSSTYEIEGNYDDSTDVSCNIYNTIADYSGTGYAKIEAVNGLVDVLITVPQDDTYTFTVKSTAGSSQKPVTLKVYAGTATSGSLYSEVITTGTGNVWATDTTAGVALTAGQYRIRFICDQSQYNLCIDNFVVTGTKAYVAASTYTANANVATACTSMGSATVATTSGGAGAASQTIDANGSAYYVATANSGYQFVKWVATDDVTAVAVSTNASYTATITANTTLYAVFEATAQGSQYVANFEFEDGTVTGTSVKVDGTNGNDPATFLVEGAVVTGYSSTGYTYVASGLDGAYITFTTPIFAAGTDVFTFTGYTASNYNLGQQLNYYIYEGTGTSGTLVTSGNTTCGYTTTFTGDLIVNATLSSNTTYTFYVEAPASWGHIAIDKVNVTSTNIIIAEAKTATVELASGCASMGSATVAATNGGAGAVSQEVPGNGYAYYVATANDGYKFVKWVAVNDVDAVAVSTEASYAATVTDDITLYAVFTNATAYTISTAVNNAEYGSVSEGGIVYENGSITLTATPVSGYAFVYWSTDGGVTSVSTTNPLTISNPTASADYTAVFEITYDRTISAAVASACKNGGTATVATTSGGEGGESQVITIGNNAYFVATAATGYAFSKWVATDDANAEAVSTSASYTMEAISGDAVLYAVFVPTAICQDDNTVKVFFENSNLNYGSWTDKDVKYTGSSATFYNADGTVNFYDNGVEIKGRGNYTWTSVQPDGKKPFQVKFSSKVQPLGLGDGKTKTWIFLANVADQSLLRNYAIFYFADQLDGLSSAEIDGFISDAETVEVWINGTYYGVYLLCEKCETGKTRIDVPEPETAEETEFGFLVERDYYATSEDTGTWFTVDGVNYTIKSDIVFDAEASNAANNAQNTIIKNYISAVNTAIKGQDEATIRSLIDVDSFVDMYIVQEFAKNCDVGYSSFYMYTDSVTSGKLFLGPVWDADIALGNNDKFDNGLYTGLYAGMTMDTYNNASGAFKSQANEWFVYLLDTEWFENLVIDRWSEIRANGLVEETIAAVNAEYTANSEAFIHNFDKWGYPTSPTNAEPDAILALEHPGNDNINHVNYLTNWMANRATYLDTLYYDNSTVDKDGNTRYIGNFEFEEGTTTGNSVIVDGTTYDPATYTIDSGSYQGTVTGWSADGYVHLVSGEDGAYVTFTTPTFGTDGTGSETFYISTYLASRYPAGQNINYAIYEGTGITGTLLTSGSTTCGYDSVFASDLAISQVLSSNTTYTFYLEAAANYGNTALDKIKVISSSNIVVAIAETLNTNVVTNGDAEDTTGGIITKNKESYFYNDTVTLTASANTGYIFTGWYDAETDGTALSTEATYSFVIRENTTIYARFVEGYVVTTTAYSDKVTTGVMAADAEAATITGAGTYFAATEVTITATPTVGYTFVNWTDTSDTVLATTASYTFQMNTYDMDLKANFNYVGTYTLTVETNNGGTVSGTTTGTYNKGHNVSLMAIPVGAASFAKWQMWNGTEYIDYSTDRTITFALNSNTTIKAVYDLSLATSTTYEWEEAYEIGTGTSYYSVDGIYIEGDWSSDTVTEWSNDDYLYLTQALTYAVIEVDLRGTTEVSDYTFTTYGAATGDAGKSVWVNLYKDVYTEHDSADRQYIGAYTICTSATESVGTPITVTGLEPGIYYFEIVADGYQFCLDKLVVSAETAIIPEHTVTSYEAFKVSGNIMAASGDYTTPYCEIVIPRTAAGLDAVLNAGLVNYEGAELYNSDTWENGVDVSVVYTIDGVEYEGTATISMVLGAGSGNKYTAGANTVAVGSTSKLQLSWDENGTVNYVALTLKDLDPSLIGETAVITVNKIIYRTQPIVDLSDKSENMIIRGDEVPNPSAGASLGYTDSNGASWMDISTVIDPEDSFNHRVWQVDYSLDTANPNDYGVYAGVYRAISDLNVNAEEGKGFSFWYRTPENDTTGMTLNFCMQSNLYPTGEEGQPIYVYLEPTYGDWKPMYIEYDLTGSYGGTEVTYWDVFVNYVQAYEDGLTHTMTASDGTFWLSELRIEKLEQVGVTYKNYTGQVLEYQMIDKYSVTTPPEYVTRQEHTFVGWLLDTTATIYESGTEDFTNHFSTGITENRVYTAQYALSGQYYKIDVVNGNITNLNNAGNVKKALLLYGRYVTLTAGECDANDSSLTEFQYWTANGEIVSYNTSFSTAIICQTEFKAVFAASAYTGNKNATNLYDRVTVYDAEHLKSKNTITFNCAFTYDSDNYTVKAFGILVTNNQTIADLSGTGNDIMVISSAEASTIVSASTNTGAFTHSYDGSNYPVQWCKYTSTIYWEDTLAMGLYTIKLANLSNGVSRYAISYLILEDNTTHELSVYLSTETGDAYRSGTISAVA